MRNVSFIDREGNSITADNVRRHEELAHLILEKNSALNKEYETSNIQDPIDFLILKKGYIKFTELMYYKRCVFSSSKISSKQRKIIDYYLEKGFVADDIDMVNMEKHTRE